MTSPPSNGREGDGKEHRSYNDPIQEMSSGREVPVAAIGAGLRSERLDLREQKPDDQVVPPASIAQPMSSNSTEVEESEYLEERYSQSPQPANKTMMKVATCMVYLVPYRLSVYLMFNNIDYGHVIIPVLLNKRYSVPRIGSGRPLRRIHMVIYTYIKVLPHIPHVDKRGVKPGARPEPIMLA